MKKVILVSFLLLFLNPTNTFALSCVEMRSIEKAYEKYDGVIIGYVDKVVHNKESNQIKLKVIKSFKGIEEDEISAEENITWGSLWGPSEIGEEYLYFLRKKDSEWENPLCSPTMKVADASEELEFLQNKEVPLKSVSVPTESYSDDKNVSEPSSDEKTVAGPMSINSTAEEPTSIHWTANEITVFLIGVSGYAIIRYTKQRR